MNSLFRILLLTLAFHSCLFAQDSEPTTPVRVRDITTIEGVRDNPLVGYGLVIGLNGTGDRRQTIFTTQMLSNTLQHMGVQVPATSMRVNNVAAVIVTATLPPFARPGTQLDVTVSSIGDAKSLEGGTLLVAPMRAANGDIFATAQGPLSVSGYAAGGAGNVRQVNHPTVGRIPGGGIVERETPFQLADSERVSLMLRSPDFALASEISTAINREFHSDISHAVNSRYVQVKFSPNERAEMSAAIARVQSLQVQSRMPARVVVNERSGTIVMGKKVRLSAVSILHGNLSVEISTEYSVSQPGPFSQGETTVVPKQTVRTTDSPVRKIELPEGATVEQLVNGLQTIGATSRDVVSILQALKAAGALQGELEIL